MKIDPRFISDGWRYAHGAYSRHSDGAMCKEGRLCNDGPATVVSCNIKGAYAHCETCEYNDDYYMFIEKNDTMAELVRR